MLEIILVIFMCKSIGKKLRAKGRKPLVFQFMLVVMWIGGEIAGGIATAARLTGSEAGAPTLYLALLIDGRWQLHRSDDGGAGFGRVGFLTDFWGSLAAFPADTEALILT